MKIVIDIDENILNDAKSGRVRLGEIADAVLNGTVLPEGHGDLIDLDALKGKLWWTNGCVLKELDEMEPVIKADGEVD